MMQNFISPVSFVSLVSKSKLLACTDSMFLSKKITAISIIIVESNRVKIGKEI